MSTEVTSHGVDRPTAVQCKPVEFSIFTEARFGKDSSGRWAAKSHSGGPDAWYMYGHGGNRVRAVVRAVAQSGGADVLLPDDLNVTPLPYYIGFRGLVRTLPALMIAVWRAVAGAEAIVLRLPGPIGGLAALMCRVQRRRYAVEVIADPVGVLRCGAIGRAGRLLVRPAAAYMRWIVRGASASMFVTRHSLQRLYPPRPETPAVAVSDVRVGSDGFVTHSRRWTPAPFRLVTIGAQGTPYKGHDVLLKAIRRLVDNGVNVAATIVGGGRIHQDLVELARRLGLAERVTFTGEINDRARIVEILDSASLAVFSSRSEGLPRALVEAMARALPAVASRVGGIPELLDPSCLVPVEDDRALAITIGRLLTDPREWEVQSQRNLQTARTYAPSLLEAQFLTWLPRLPVARSRPTARSGA